MPDSKMLDIIPLQRVIRLGDFYTRQGKVSKIMGLMVEATGLECNMGDICQIQLGQENFALAEVVGILGNTVQLMPYQELDGIGSGSIVINTGRKLEVGITPGMLGRAVDALGRPHRWRASLYRRRKGVVSHQRTACQPNGAPAYH